MLPAGYENTNFAGPGGLASPELDRFIDLVDSLTTRKVPLDETAFAEYYNKMANAITRIQEYITYTPGSTSCPTGTAQIDIVGDGSLTSLSTPRTFTVTLEQVGKFLHPTFPLSIQGSILPFEFVITNSQDAYPSHPVTQMVTYDPAFVEKANDGTVYATCSLDLKSKSDTRPYLEPVTYGLYGGYNSYYAYLFSLCIHYNTYVLDDAVIVRGYIRDRAAQGLTVNQKTILQELGPKVELHCGVLLTN